MEIIFRIIIINPLRKIKIPLIIVNRIIARLDAVGTHVSKIFSDSSTNLLTVFVRSDHFWDPTIFHG